jgi:imidazolonepropionase
LSLPLGEQREGRGEASSGGVGRRIVRALRVCTCDPDRSTAGNPLGVIEDGALLLDEHGAIADVGNAAEIAARHPDVPVAGHPAELLTPGLVDAHTHAPWVGSRAGEYVLRMAGGDYEAIAAAGGGIAASMRAVRAANGEQIAGELRARLRRMASLGVTTVEAKSGYGLDEASERKQLEAVADASRHPDLPRVVPTYLALHALPPEARGLARGGEDRGGEDRGGEDRGGEDRGGEERGGEERGGHEKGGTGSPPADSLAADRALYAERVAGEWLPAIAKARLARFADAYVDRSAFSVDDARRVLSRARELGLGVRIHAGQFADVGAAELAASLGAASADHLENVGAAGIDALAAAGVRAVLLPIASFTLRQAPPPIAAFRAAGVPLVVASDSNPGTAPSESLPLALALAVRLYGLTVAEALLGATREAAASLGLGEVCGVLRAGLRADVTAWDLPHEDALVEPWGVARAAWVLRDGRRIDRA